MTFSRTKLLAICAAIFVAAFTIMVGGNLTGQAAGNYIKAQLASNSSAAGGSGDPHCIQHGTKNAFLCYYHEPGTGGGIYATLVLFENWYYWHPKTGDMVVDETYAKSGAPGYTSTNGHRTIHFADAHEIADPAWLAGFPDNKTPPAQCSQPESGGAVTPCSAVEQQSAMDFQHAIATDNPPHSY
jgi:hypothetical protein